jgi:hypothetical protein
LSNAVGAARHNSEDYIMKLTYHAGLNLDFAVSLALAFAGSFVIVALLVR